MFTSSGFERKKKLKLELMNENFFFTLTQVEGRRNKEITFVDNFNISSVKRPSRRKKSYH